MVDKELLELVRRLSASGRTEPEIIGQLRAAGFKPAEIDAAMKSVLKERIERPAMQAAPSRPLPAPPSALAPSRPPASLAPSRPVPHELPPEAAEVPEHLRPMEIPGATKFAPVAPVSARPAARPAAVQPPAPRAQAPGATAAPYRPSGPGSEVTLDELVEQILAENMKKLEVRLNNVDKRDTQIESQLAEARKLLEEARGMDSRLDRTMAAHVDEFKDFMSTFEARISALEKAFKSLSDYVKK
jgi:hypothetical protein